MIFIFCDLFFFFPFIFLSPSNFFFFLPSVYFTYFKNKKSITYVVHIVRESGFVRGIGRKGVRLSISSSVIEFISFHQFHYYLSYSYSARLEGRK